MARYLRRGPVRKRISFAARSGRTDGDGYSPLTPPHVTHKYRLMALDPHWIHRYGREWRIGAIRFPISPTITGVVLELEPTVSANCTGIPTRTSGNPSSEGQFNVSIFGSHGRYRSARAADHTKTNATSKDPGRSME